MTLRPSISIMAMPGKLRTERLAMRPLGLGDLDAVHALFSSAGHTIGDGPVRDRADTLRWLERRAIRYDSQGLAWHLDNWQSDILQ